VRGRDLRAATAYLVLQLNVRVVFYRRKSLYRLITKAFSGGLRGKEVYIRLRYGHRELNDKLQAAFSDRWVCFGTLWTGSLTTNAFTIDVPMNPQAASCKDNHREGFS
jgi:hypothetical protein